LFAKFSSGPYYFTFYVNSKPVLLPTKPASSWNFSNMFYTSGQAIVYVKVKDAILSSYSAQTNTVMI